MSYSLLQCFKIFKILKDVPLSTANSLLRQAMEKFAQEMGDTGQLDQKNGKGKIKVGSSSKAAQSFGDQRPSKTTLKMDAACSPRESLLQKSRDRGTQIRSLKN